MDLSFAELQQLAESQYTIEDTRNDLLDLVRYFQSLPYWEYAIQEAFVKERKLSFQTAVEHDVFFVDESTQLYDLEDKFKNESLGFVKNKTITQLGRLVYPVKDVKGNIMGLTGWDKYVKPKYLDSKNFGYKAKATTMFGMEKLPEYYQTGKPVFVLEGPVDCMYLREKGFQALSTLGSYLNKYCAEILRRFGDRLFVIPDMDESGNSYVQQVKNVLPKAHVLQVVAGKDVDGYRKMNDGEFEQQILTDLNMASMIPMYPTKSFYVR